MINQLYPCHLEPITDIAWEANVDVTADVDAISKALPNVFTTDALAKICRFVKAVCADEKLLCPVRNKKLEFTTVVASRERVFISLGQRLPFSGGQGVKFKKAVMISYPDMKVAEVIKLVLNPTEDSMRRISCMQRLGESPFFPTNFGFFTTAKRISIYQEWACKDLLEFYETRENALFELSGETKKIVVVDLISALATLKKNEIVHRDIKLENILLMTDGHLKLTDFGSARREGDPARKTPAGTEHCWPPDSVRGTKTEYTAQDDIWQLGLVLHLLVSRDMPKVEEILYELNPNNRKSVLEKWSFAIKELPKPPEKLTSFSDLVCAMLQEKRENRITPERALEVIDLLKF